MELRSRNRFMPKMKRKIGKFFLYFILLLILFITLQYALCPVYDFPEPKTFYGNQWYNPYEGMENKADWYKANFHTHSKAWLGITSGKDTPEKIYKTYQEMGYDIICISNYQSINQSINTFQEENNEYIPVYEHGMNIRKNHQLVIGAQKVSWKDFFLLQNVHNKQNIINHLKEDGTFLVLAHPIWNNAYTPNDVKALTGYDALEVLIIINAQLNYGMWPFPQGSQSG